MPVHTNSSTPILSRLQSLNPFGSGEGYVSLPTNTGEGPGAPLPAPSRREEEESFFAREFPFLITRPLLDYVCYVPFLQCRPEHS